jgi:pimeloyl-ACP methyl ester carboxylesterase
MPTVSVNTIDLYYQSAGAGPPVLLIAGFGCDHTAWAPVAGELAGHFRVISFDNRGIGQSTGAVTDIHPMADDAAALIAALGVGPVGVVGHSMGGMIAQELALHHPGRVRSLVLLSSAAALDARARAVIESWGELPARLEVAAATRLILPWLYTNRFFAVPGAVASLIELIVHAPHPPAPAVIAAQSHAIAQFDARGRLSGVRCPTLVAVGREDVLLPPAFSEELVRLIPGAELALLEATGHNALIETPDAVANAVRRFLA